MIDPLPWIDATGDIMHIRPFQADDVDRVVELHRAAVEDVCSADYTADQIAAWTDTSTEESLETAQRDEIHRFVAVEDDTVIGFGEYNADEAKITGLYVAPDRMGSGAGTALLERVEEDARQQGIDVLECFSTVTARTFYEQHGYTVVEQTMYEMGDVELSAYHMRKQLDGDG